MSTAYFMVNIPAPAIRSHRVDRDLDSYADSKKVINWLYSFRKVRCYDRGEIRLGQAAFR